MSENPPPLPSASTGAGAERRLPGWMGALRGIWLMTWRSQLNLRRLPGQLGMLLALPLLVYVTTLSPSRWAGRHISMGDSSYQVNTLAHRLKRLDIPLESKTVDELKTMMAAANRQSESTWREISGETAEDRRKRADEHVAAWNRGVLSGARSILNDVQYDEFKTLQQHNRDNAMRRLTEVSIPWRREEPFYHWLIGFYFFFIMPLTCVRLCGPIIRDELQADTLGFLITRPVGRARLLVVKYVAQVVWLEMILLLQTLLIFAAGAAQEVSPLGSLLLLVLAVQILVIPAWSALGALLGQITTRYMAGALLYGAIVEMGIGRIPTNINCLSIIRHLEVLLSHNNILQSTFAWNEGSAATALCVLVAAPFIFLGIAALLFSLIEYHHAAEMQK